MGIERTQLLKMAEETLSSRNRITLIPIFEAFLSNISRRFDFLRIGPLCNGSRSFSFSEAFCDLEHIEIPGNIVILPLSVYMSVLFDRAYEIIRTQISEENITLSSEEEQTLDDLQKFLLNIETHSKNILNAYEKMKTEPDKEKVLSIAVAEHLISPLASGYMYSMNARAQGQGQDMTCKCGCNKPVHFGATGIGHHKVWHGFLDIAIYERKDQTDPVFALKVVTDQNTSRDEGHIEDSPFVDVHDTEDNFVPSPTKRRKFQDVESLDLSSVSGESIPKVKINRHIEDQTVAQTIVLALTQKQRCSNTNRFVPSVLICDTKFYIIMYEPVKDILTWSGEFPLFDKFSPNSLNVTAIITLWMVLHYKLFCSGGEIFENLQEVKAGFLDQIKEEKRGYYEHLITGVENFETETEKPGFTALSHQVSDNFILAKIKQGTI